MDTHRYRPTRLVLLDIDALRSDVFIQALHENRLPNIARILGSNRLENIAGLYFDAISNAPSVTYCCQASSFTGAHPRQHWIPGNMFFDRFGRINEGRPRQYQFDFLDAPQVFLQGLAGRAINPEVDTIYETASLHGLVSTVAYNMYAHGAQYWLKPGADEWKLFASVTSPDFGEKYDDRMLADVIQHLQSGKRPDILTLYFFGLDHESHLHGPQVQVEYMEKVIDRQVGVFLDAYQDLGLAPGTLYCLFSDHGQIAVLNDDLHALKVGLLFDREYGYVFQGLGLDVNDHWLEDDHCDALLNQCGGMAQVYLKRRDGQWSDPPRFQEDVLRLAQAFWDSNQHGKYSKELQDALEMIAVRNVEHDGWYADYQAYTPQGLLSIADFEAVHPELEMVDAANRLHYMSSPVTGDILLFSNTRQGYSFTLLPYKGMHGGLHPEDSTAILSYTLPQGEPEQIVAIQQTIFQAIQQRCLQENNRRVSNVDVAFGLRQIMGW